MRISNVLRSLASGAVLYVVMAACGSSDSGGGSVDAGSGGLDGADIIDAMIDDLGNPVKDAKADPLPPEVATEPCDKSGTLSVSPASYMFAVHDFPGRTVNDLANLRVVGHYGNAGGKPMIAGPPYEYGGAVPSLRDGSATVNCGTSGALAYDSITFILPR